MLKSCTICLQTLKNDEQLGDNIISPCACKSVFLHRKCLYEWIVAKPKNHKTFHCEVCKSPYFIPREDDKQKIACRNFIVQEIIRKHGMTIFGSIVLCAATFIAIL
jgi:E3 ubiquitin-protein ligase DOA10